MEEDKIPVYGELISGVPDGYVADISQIRGMEEVVSSTQNAIIVAGGPLEDDVKEGWPEEWKDEQGNKVIPAGMTLEGVLNGLFLKRKTGKVSWGAVSWKPELGNPIVNLNITDTVVEVGTTVTITAQAASTVSNNKRTCILQFDEDCGYFIGDEAWSNKPYTEEKNGNSLTGKPTLDFQVSGGSLNDKILVVGDGNNTITVTQQGNEITCSALPKVTAYASTNTKEKISVGVILNDKESTSKQLSKSITKQITGVRYTFWGVDNGNESLDSDYIRGFNHIKNTSATATYDINAKGGRRIWIALPPGKKLTSFYNDSLGSNMGDVLKQVKNESINIEGANGYKAAAYNVVTFTSEADFESVYKITIG